MNAFFPKIIPEFTVFKFLAKIAIKAVGLLGYYFLFIGLTVFICLKYAYKALQDDHMETFVLIIIFMLILIGGIIALVNS